MRFLSLCLLAAIPLACATSDGALHFERGNELKQQGKLAEAKSAYGDATRAEPDNPEYKRAFEDIDTRIADKVRNLAKSAEEKEDARDFGAAAKAWEEAAALAPDDRDIQAHASISKARLENLSPPDWYARVEKIAKDFPESEVPKQALNSAKEEAYAHQVREGDRLMGEGKPLDAAVAYDKARKIDPELPGVDKDKLDRADAARFMQKGDEEMKSGSYVEAYELYRKSHEITHNREAFKKMSQAKARAGDVIKKLEAARSKAKAGSFKAALKLYGDLEESGKGPSGLDEEMADVRKEAVQAVVRKAQKPIASKRFRSLPALVKEAVSYSGFDPSISDRLVKASKDIPKRPAHEVLQAFEGSGAPAEHPIVKLGQEIALAKVQGEIKQLRALSDKDPIAARARLQLFASIIDQSPALSELSEKVGLDKKEPESRAVVSGSGDDGRAAVTPQGTRPEKKEVEALLDKARSEKSDKKCAKTLEKALDASSIASSQRRSAKEALDAFAGGRYAESEKGLTPHARASRVAEAALEIVHMRRIEAEDKALASITEGKQLEKNAGILASGRLVDPKSERAGSAKTRLVELAKSRASEGDNRGAADALLGAIVLEETDRETSKKLEAAARELGKNKSDEAKTMFEAVAEKGGEAARVGTDVSVRASIHTLEQQLEKAKKKKDIHAQGEIVQKILALDPSHEGAKALQPSLEQNLSAAYVARAKKAKSAGRLAEAYVLLDWAHEMEPDDSGTTSELGAVGDELKKAGNDLVVMVGRVSRSKDAASGYCKKIEEQLRSKLMTVGSKRTDLGLYILGETWTKKVNEKAKDAPTVSGIIESNVDQCKNGAATGQIKLSWKLLVPEGGKPTAEGTVEDEIPETLLPRDEQDGSGKNTTKALAKRAAKKVTDQIAEKGDQVDDWLLVLSEDAMKKKNKKAVVDAYARLLLVKPSVDEARKQKVDAYVRGILR